MLWAVGHSVDATQRACSHRRSDRRGPRLVFFLGCRPPVGRRRCSVGWSRLSHLVDLPEGDDVGKAVDEAIKAIEAANPELKDILPRGYQKLERSTLIELLRPFAPLPTQLEGDAFGFIYEDFLSHFAAQEGKGGTSLNELRGYFLGGMDSL